jgi:galactokinase
MLNDAQIRAGFTRVFGGEASQIIFSPGRVNLIGEHTDYNDGFVFPTALTMGTSIAGRARNDGLLKVYAERMGASDEAPLSDLRPKEGPDWTRYVRGVAALLLEAGYELVGADLYIDSDLPLGSGLSSSASIEMGVAVSLLNLIKAPFDRVKLARLGQRVENEIIGLQSGIMDQLSVATGVESHILLIDCRVYSVEPVSIPTNVSVVVLDSAAPRTLASSAYNERRAQCESVVSKLQAVDPNIRALRDVSLELLEAEKGRITPIEYKRALHVVTENQRVLDSTSALSEGDVKRFGELMNASHASMRDDYEISSKELDTLVEIALATPGVLGARLTGAGFGGCAVALVEVDKAEAAGEHIAAAYREAIGLPGNAYICTPSAGTYVLWEA